MHCRKPRRASRSCVPLWWDPRRTPIKCNYKIKKKQPCSPIIRDVFAPHMVHPHGPNHPDSKSMKVIGIDFTSSPTRKKPLTCMHCTLEGRFLLAGNLEEWSDFRPFEEALEKPGPWIAGIDFPFGQSRTFVENIGWPASWAGYIEHSRSLGREGFRKALNAYRERRPFGDKEHRRVTDIAAGSISPQKIYGVPVGLMFFEGAPRLIKSASRSLSFKWAIPRGWWSKPIQGCWHGNS